MRNEWGGWIKGFQRRIGITNSLVAELWAIRDGLTMASNLGVHNLHVEADAQEAINLIIEDPYADRPLMPLILDCRKLILDFNKFKIRHVFREANGVADALAKEAVTLDDPFHTLTNPPSDILKLLIFDSEVKSTTRIVKNN